MKKRLLSLLLVAVMALSVVACGGSEEAPAEESGEVTEVKDTFTYSVFSDLGTTLNYFTADSREAMTFVKLVDTPLFSMLPDGSLHFYMAESFETEDGVTPLQAKLDSLGKILGVAALVICAIIFAVGCQ